MSAEWSGSVSREPHSFQEIYDIDSLGLPTPLRNALVGSALTTFNRLHKASLTDLLAIPGIDSNGAESILESFSYTLETAAAMKEQEKTQKPYEVPLGPIVQRPESVKDLLSSAEYVTLARYYAWLEKQSLVSAPPIENVSIYYPSHLWRDEHPTANYYRSVGFPLALPTLEAAYTATTDILSGKLTNGLPTQDGIYIAKGLIQVLGTLDAMVQGVQRWSGVGDSSDLKRNHFRNLFAYQGYSSVQASFSPEKYSFSLNWLETTPRFRRSLGKDSVMVANVRSEIDQVDDRHPNLFLDIDVKRLKVDPKSGVVLPGRNGNVVDRLLGRNRHHIRIASGEKGHLQHVQRALLDQLNLTRLYEEPRVFLIRRDLALD